jgi:hypothetical protein
VVGCDAEHAWRPSQDRPGDQVGLAMRQPAHQQVDLAASQASERVAVGCPDDPAFGVALLEGADDREQVRSLARRGEQRQAQRALQAPIVVVGGLEHTGELVVGGADLLAEALAERGQLHVPVGSEDELAAQLAFQAAKALADPRGRHPEPLGGAAEVELLGECEEDPQLTKLDRLPHKVVAFGKSPVMPRAVG